MKLLLLSDSHGTARMLARLQAVLEAEKPDAILFAGDGIHDMRRFEGKLPVYKVRGNCDIGETGVDELVIPLAGQTIYLAHGHHHQVKRQLDMLASDARGHDAGIAVYGHTHKQALDMEARVWCINPGSLKQGEYALLNLPPDGSMSPVFRRLSGLP